jgi:hypothetical protein
MRQYGKIRTRNRRWLEVRKRIDAERAGARVQAVPHCRKDAQMHRMSTELHGCDLAARDILDKPQSLRANPDTPWTISRLIVIRS